MVDYLIGRRNGAISNSSNRRSSFDKKEEKGFSSPFLVRMTEEVETQFFKPYDLLLNLIEVGGINDSSSEIVDFLRFIDLLRNDESDDNLTYLFVKRVESPPSGYKLAAVIDYRYPDRNEFIPAEQLYHRYRGIFASQTAEDVPEATRGRIYRWLYDLPVILLPTDQNDY